MIAAQFAEARQSFRRVLRRPGTAILIVLSLGFAIGLNVALFSVLDRFLLTPLPVPSPETLYEIRYRDLHPAAIPSHPTLPYPDYLEAAKSLSSFSGIAFERRQGALLTIGGRQTSAYAHLVSRNYFTVLGVPIRHGPGLDRPGQSVVISHGFWMRELGGAPNVTGQALLLNGASFTIAAIAHPEFRGTERLVPIDLWIPVDDWLEQLPQFRKTFNRRDVNDGHIWSRVRAGVTRNQARAEVEAFAGDMAREWPQTNRQLTGYLGRSSTNGTPAS